MMPSVDVIIPVFNEEATVGPLVERLRRAYPGASLIFVDNGSTDRTLEILDSLGDVRDRSPPEQPRLWTLAARRDRRVGR